MFSRRSLVVVFALASMLLLIGVGVAMAREPMTLTPNQQLGKSIFFDESLSINQNEACAACHGPAVGWTGPDAAINAHGAVYEGSISGRFGNRKPPSAAYAAQSPIFHFVKQAGGMFIGGNFWDGRATGQKLGNPAADQAQGPFLNPMEQALPDAACVVYRVSKATYPVSFEEVWGTEAGNITWPTNIESLCATEGSTVPLSAQDRARVNAAYNDIALSIADYESSFEVSAFTSKFDASRTGKAKLTQQEREGFALFQGKAKCGRCHVSTGQQPLFTDYTYDNLGIPKNPENPVYNRIPGFTDLGLGGFLQSAGYPSAVSQAQMGKFKVPTLRNVDLRPYPGFVKAYGHNGYFKSLEEIVHFYNTRDVLPQCEIVSDPQASVKCWPAPEVAANMNTKEVGNLGLSPEEEAAIVAFLKTLSDGYTK
jgi:cytochrome c peroxidase